LRQKYDADFCSQVSLFALAAVISGLCYGLQHRLLLWRRRGWEVDGDRIWKHMGLCSSWLCAGCVAGVIVFATDMCFLTELYESDPIYSNITARQKYDARVASLRCSAVKNVFSPLQILCIIFAMNMLLRRVSDHASHSYYNRARDYDDDGSKRFDCRDCVGQYRLYYSVRTVHVLAMLLCALNIVSRIVVAAFRAEAARRFDEAAAACDAEGKDTERSLDLERQSLLILETGFRSEVASQVAEAVIFLLEAGSFMLFCPTCIIMFYRVKRRMDAILLEMSHRSDIGNVFLPFEFLTAESNGCSTQVEMQIVEARAFLGRIRTKAASRQRQFSLCTVLVTMALLAQACSSVLHAIVLFVPRNFSCGPCDACQSAEYYVGIWYNMTPEIFRLVPSLCSTLPQLFSLWLMTTKDDRAMMLNPSRFRTAEIELQPLQDETLVNLKRSRIRMGIDLD
jgi:hypothetical protein